MRTTVTLDDDTLALIRKRMAERGTSFKKALNDAIREGAARRPAPPAFTTRSKNLGVPAVNLDRALQLAAELEDEELIRRLRRDA
ncbi:MAG: ribbon-helix-helix protein, CopG family [Mycobacterium sp.]|nr:ribbon-helix-helix protein, CopG family [Mycobacterium sp.]